MSQFIVDEMVPMTGGKQISRNQQVSVDKAPRDYKVNPAEIMVQCLYRPNEAIHPHLIASSYDWVGRGIRWQRIMDPFGGWVHISRNYMSQIFLKRKECKYLLMLDSDEAVPWWIPYHMASVMQEQDLKVLSGVVCGFTAERGLFACVAVKGPDGRARFPSVKETRTIPAAGVQEVHNAGTGCLMVRRDLMEALWMRYHKDQSFGQPFGIPEKEQNLAAMQGALPRGEDVCFTDRVRELGEKVYVDWACKIGHQKPFLLAWPGQSIYPGDPQKWAKMAWPGVGKQLEGKPKQGPKRPLKTGRDRGKTKK